MKYLLLLISLAASAQQIKNNPITGLPDLVGGGGGTGAAPYGAAVAAQTTLSVTAATHGQGTDPIATCYEGTSPFIATACSYTKATNGDIVFTWSPAFTGRVVIIGGGTGATGATGPAGSYTIGSGLQQIGDQLSVDTAVVPTKAAANTFAELQTLQKGANIASSTALATAGDIRYNSGDIQYRDGSGSITLMDNPFTTRGDLVIQGASGPARLAAGASGYFLMANGPAADPSYQIPNASQITNAFDKSTGNTISAGVQDFSGTTFRVPSSTTLPATCATGDSYMDTNATSGQRWYLCESANTWVVQGGGGGGGSPGGSSGQPQYNDGAGGFSGLGYLQDGANFRIKWDTVNGDRIQVRNNADSGAIGLGASFFAAAAGGPYFNNNGYFTGSNSASFTDPGWFGAAAVISLTSADGISWSSTSSTGGARDLGLLRASSGNLKVTDGSSGLGKIVVSQSTPAASSDACTAGAMWADASYIYACTASGTIKRAALSTF